VSEVGTVGSNFKLQNSKNFGNFDLILEKNKGVARQFGYF